MRKKRFDSKSKQISDEKAFRVTTPPVPVLRSMDRPPLRRQKSAGLLGVSVTCSSPHNPGDDFWSLKGQLADSLSVGELRAWVEVEARAKGKVRGGDEGHEMEAAGGLKIILISQGEQLTDDAQRLLALGISPTCGAHGPTFALHAVERLVRYTTGGVLRLRLGD